LEWKLAAGQKFQTAVSAKNADYCGQLAEESPPSRDPRDSENHLKDGSREAWQCIRNETSRD